MMLIAAGWITILLLVGGLALNRTLTMLVTGQFDDQLDYVLTAMIGSAEIGPDGEVYFNRPLGDQRFLEPNSGFYWQITGPGHEPFPSRSLWDRTLKDSGDGFEKEPRYYDSYQFAGEPLRVVERSVVLPGSKSTVDDLAWLRETGLADAVTAHAAAGRPLLGICGGYQMLGNRIHDDVESRRGTVDGLGLLPIEVAFAVEKTLARPTGSSFGVEVSGYEIHHGYVSSGDTTPLIHYADGTGEGARQGNVFGTHWHGAFESDEFRRAFLSVVARRAGRHGFKVAPDTDFAALRERGLDLLGDLVEEHLDTDALWRLIEDGTPAGLPFIPPGAP